MRRDSAASTVNISKAWREVGAPCLTLKPGLFQSPQAPSPLRNPRTRTFPSPRLFPFEAPALCHMTKDRGSLELALGSSSPWVGSLGSLEGHVI